MTIERKQTEWQIEDSSDRRLRFEFDGLGRLISATTPEEHTLRFGYNELGLRETTDTTYGARVRYLYDSSGSLFHSATGYQDRDMPAYTYILGPDQRIEAVSGSNGALHSYDYDERGLLNGVRVASDNQVRFDYDELSRLTRVQFKDDPPLAYEYALGEPDIAAQLSYRALPVFNQQKEIADFASRFDLTLTRIRPAALGLLTYNDTTHELTLAGDPTRWTPMAYLSRSIGALHIESLLADGGRGIQSFSSPANRLFVPREYWSVNCCICICYEPNPDIQCNQP